MPLTNEELLRKATRFSFLPEGADLAKYRKDYYFEITVELRSRGTWAVCSMGEIWNGSRQEWEGEPRNSSLTEEDFTSIRFTLDEAVEIAGRLVDEHKFLAPYSWSFWKNHPERLNVFTQS